MEHGGSMLIFSRCLFLQVPATASQDTLHSCLTLQDALSLHCTGEMESSDFSPVLLWAVFWRWQLPLLACPGGCSGCSPVWARWTAWVDGIGLDKESLGKASWQGCSLDISFLWRLLTCFTIFRDMEYAGFISVFCQKLMSHTVISHKISVQSSLYKHPNKKIKLKIPDSVSVLLKQNYSSTSTQLHVSKQWCSLPVRNKRTFAMSELPLELWTAWAVMVAGEKSSVWNLWLFTIMICYW